MIEDMDKSPLEVAALRWYLAMDAARSVGFAPIGEDDDPEVLRHRALAAVRYQASHEAYVALEVACQEVLFP